MVEYGGSSAGSYLADPTSPIPSHCAPIVVTSTVRVNNLVYDSSDQTYVTYDFHWFDTQQFVYFYASPDLASLNNDSPN